MPRGGLGKGRVGRFTFTSACHPGEGDMGQLRDLISQKDKPAVSANKTQGVRYQTSPSFWWEVDKKTIRLL